VVNRSATLVLGAGLDPEVMAVAERVAGEQHAEIVVAGSDPGVTVGAAGVFQRRNFALAIAAARAFLGELDADAVAAAAEEVRVPGRLQEIDSEPLTLLDGAHNPDGMGALVESLAELSASHERTVAVVSILEDKDAAGMLASLLPTCDALIVTSSQNPRALPPPTLLSLSSQLHGPPAEVVRDPRRALGRARQLAGPRGLVIATGSIYLIADLLAPASGRRASSL
jgi:dihydrofolate synthase/folylpolyglutamate synthase